MITTPTKDASTDTVKDGWMASLNDGELVGPGCGKGMDYLLARVRQESSTWGRVCPQAMPIEVRREAVRRLMDPANLNPLNGCTVGSIVRGLLDKILQVMAEGTEKEPCSKSTK